MLTGGGHAVSAGNWVAQRGLVGVEILLAWQFACFALPSLAVLACQVNSRQLAVAAWSARAVL